MFISSNINTLRIISTFDSRSPDVRLKLQRSPKGDIFLKGEGCGEGKTKKKTLKIAVIPVSSIFPPMSFIRLVELEEGPNEGPRLRLAPFINKHGSVCYSVTGKGGDPSRPSGTSTRIPTKCQCLRSPHCFRVTIGY